MTTKTPSPGARLRADLKDLNAWAVGYAGNNYNPLEQFLREYPGWSDLSAAFVNFLTAKPLATWNARDYSLIRQAVIDWAHHRWLNGITEDSLATLLLLPFCDQVIRSYMLVRGSRITDQSIRERVLLHFFEHDESDAVRDSALTSLAYGRWELAEQHAERLWESGDVVKRLVALQCLQAAKSDLLGKYVDIALNGDDNILRSVAHAISSVEAFGQT